MDGPYIRIEDSGDVIQLCEAVTTIGRGAGVDIRLSDPSVSRLHAEVVRRGPYAYVTDLGLSRNGTRVNGRLVARRVLEDGDVLTFGNARCRIGGLPAEDPRIWPNLVAAQLGWDVELIGRIGWTCRDVWWAATQDPRAWAALPRAGAVIFATGGMDSLPSPLPTALRELIRYVRPSWLRRWVRDGYCWVQPRLSPVARSALPPHVSVEYLELTRGAIARCQCTGTQ